MKKITDISQLDFKKQYTYADYLTWQLKERVELIKGWLYKMSPAPSRKHQEINTTIIYSFVDYFKKNEKPCQVYTAPFDVRLVKNKGQKDKEIDTIVQPDICVVCDETKLDARGCSGSPDLVVEILSPSTGKKDYNEKYFLYEKNGVREYWIVNPDAESVEVFLLKEGKYQSEGIYSQIDGFEEVQVGIFPELKLKLNEIFEEKGVENCFISELKFGAENSKNHKKSHLAVDNFVNGLSIIPIYGIVNDYAKEKVNLRKKGTPLHDEFDLIIGITALVNNLTLVTDNYKHFKYINNLKT